MKQKIVFISVLCLSLILGMNSVNGQDKGKAKEESKIEEKKEESAYQKLFKENDDKAEGIFTLHKTKGKLYFEIPLNILGREFLIGSTLTQTSDNANSIVGSKPQSPMHVTFTKEGDYVQMRRVNCDYITPDESQVARAIKNSSIGAIILNKKIEAYNADSTAVVFEMTDFFVGDIKELSPFDDFSLYTLSGYERNVSFEKDKSYLESVKAFKDNVVIKSLLSYKYTLTNRAGRKVLNNEPFSALVTRSIILLDEEPYRARIGDYRMAIFPTGKMQFASEGQGSKSVYYSHRWRLEPKDEAAYLRGEKVEPKKPIIFYIDNNFPKAWKEYLREGVGQWSEIFEEETGFKNAVLALDYPTKEEDPEFDPDNMKYSCVRYAPVAIENAMGPSWVDPRSGEIIAASVYVYHDVISLINNWLFVQTSQTDKRVRTKDIPMEVVGDALRYVFSHEVGHCLGLMHNMSASSVIPVDSLRSATYTQKYGTTTSIMDYARFNYVAQPGDFEKGVKLTPPRFGIYDRFSIKWLYTWMGNKSIEEENRIAEAQVTEAIKNPIYKYGKQLGRAIDPRSQTEDLGDDAIKATQYGISNLKFIVENFADWIGESDKDYSYRSTIYDNIIQQYMRYINHVFTSVGGLYITELKSTDEGFQYENVPYEKQKASLDYLCSLFGDNQWIDGDGSLYKLGIMGKPSVLLDRALADAIVAAPTKVAMFEGMSDDGYKSKDCIKDIYDFVWATIKKGSKVTEAEKYLQLSWVNTALEGAGLVSKGGGHSHGAAIATDEAINNHFTIEIPGFEIDDNIYSTCENASNDMSEVAGYGGFSNKFAVLDNNNSEYYGYLKKAASMLKGAAKRSSGELKAHYTLLYNRVNNALNAE